MDKYGVANSWLLILAVSSGAHIFATFRFPEATLQFASLGAQH
jgi:hypothetical protein